MCRQLIGYLLIFACGCVNGFAQSINTGLKKVNGTSLFLSVKGAGEPLIVIHGGPGLNHSYFIPFLQGLEKELQVIYYDQRACGKSSTPSADSISMKFLVGDIEGIRKELGIDKLNILGHSWGAVLAVHYASLYPDRIKRIILTNPVMLSREFDQEAAALVKQRSTRADSVDRASIFGSGTLDTKKYDELLRISFRISAHDRGNISKINLNLPSNFMEANRSLFNALMKDPAFNLDMYNVLPSFKFPVLIVIGQSDVIPVQSIDRLQKELPNEQLIVFNKSGHFPFVEETDAYNDVVLKFLKR